MAKIMLVEDDNNLREIYEARLLAEGYEIVSAKDGEEALALAVKEKPDLIISDVMMPKISGFDMLDILRSTPETKNTKVVMMTALSQAEDKARAEKLGADKYLVKSQVTLEDVAKVAREVLEGTSAPTPSGATQGVMSSLDPVSAPSANTTTNTPTVTPTPVVAPPAPATPAPVAVTMPEPPKAPEPVAPVTPVLPTIPEPVPATSAPTPAIVAQTSASEGKTIDQQIDKFVASTAPTPTTIPITEPPETPEPTTTAPTTPTPVSEPKQISVVDEPQTQPEPTTFAPTQPVAPPVVEEKETLADAPHPGGPDRQQSEGDDVPIAHKKIIQPINDVNKKPDIAVLLAQEEANSGTQNPVTDSVIAPSGIVSASPDAPVSATGETTITPTIKPADPNSVAL